MSGRVDSVRLTLDFALSDADPTRTAYGDLCFAIAGVWNSLPTELRQSDSWHSSASKFSKCMPMEIGFSVPAPQQRMRL